MTLSTLFWILLLQFLFGLNYLVSKDVLIHYPPSVWAAMRASFTAISLIFYLALKGQLQLSQVKAHRKSLLRLAFLGVVLNQSCYLLGLKLTTPYNSALINTLIPLFTLAVAFFTKSEKLLLRQALAFMIALLGVWSLHPLSQFTWSNQTLLGDGLTVVNVAAYSSYLVLSRPLLKTQSPIWVTAWVFLLGSLGLIGLSLSDLTKTTLQLPTQSVFLTMAYGLVGGTLLPYLLLSFILTKTKSSTVALFVYLQPAIVGSLAYFFYGQHFSQEAIIATTLIFFGIFLATAPNRLFNFLPKKGHTA